MQEHTKGTQTSKMDVPAEMRSEKNTLSKLGEKIFLDRYALKDTTKSTLSVGDTVIVCVDLKTGQREIGQVLEIKEGKVSISLRDGSKLSRALEHIDKPLELRPEQMMKRVARGIAAVEGQEDKREEWEKEFAWLLDDWKFIPGGRILTAAGTEQSLSYYNCYVIPSPKDSRQGIVDTLSELMEIMSRGGGVGITLSSLRPRHSYVKGVNGRSSGSVSWGALYSFVTGLIEQGGSRRGALMLILEAWHPDVLEFINSKRTMGQITNANISVGIPDEFMDAVRNNEDWDLVFPDTSDPDYDTLWNGDMDAWKKAGKKVVVHKTVNAREIWDQLVESAWASAEPGLWFKGRTNKMSNSWYFAPLVSCNPCVTADTWISTSEGPRQVSSLVDKPFEAIVDGKSYPSSDKGFWSTGTKEVFRLQTKEGFSLRLTSTHKILKMETQHADSLDTAWVEAGTLSAGDRIMLSNQRDARPWEGDGTFGEGWLLGSLIGDGTFNQQNAVLSYWGDFRQELSDVALGYLEQHMNIRADASGCDVTDNKRSIKSRGLADLAQDLGVLRLEKAITPLIEGMSSDFYRGFLRGLFDADGSVQGSQEKGVSIRLAQSDLPRLHGVQRMLARLGIISTVYSERRPAGLRELPDGQGGTREYECRADHELVISKDNIFLFAERIGFHDPQKNEKLGDILSDYKRTPNRERFWVTVESFAFEGVEEVFDATISEAHRFDANGLIAHNCGEEPLPGYGVCNLGSLNLPRFLKETPVGDAEMDWDLLRRSIRASVRFLDNVVDSNPYFFEENRKQQMDERRVGLGTMGVGELLIRLKVRYGSDESIAFLDKLYKFIATEAYLASSDLAEEKGSFELFDADKFLQSGFMKKMPSQVQDAVSTKGIRNVTLLTQPPTGTTGTMVGTSTGIEPFFYWEYDRKSRLGTHTERVKVYDDWRRKNPDAEMPAYFVTAMDMTPQEHVRVLATIQNWVDAAISKTSNLPSDYSVSQTRELYEMMYELGCKGGTVYRDRSRDTQVLNLKEDAKEADAQSKNGAAKKNGSAKKNGNGLSANQKKQTRIEIPKESEVGYPPATPLPQTGVRPRPYKRYGVTVSKQTPSGTAHITMNDDEHHRPLEVFLEIGKAGSDIKAMAEAMGRLMSLVLRISSPLTPIQRVKQIANQIKGIGGALSLGLGKARVLSLPDAVGQAIEEHYLANNRQKMSPPAGSVRANGNGTNGQNGTTKNTSSEEPVEAELGAFADICPSCGQTSFVRTGGCSHCLGCGYSRC